MAVGGRTRRHQIGGLQVDVVEHVGDKAIGHGGGWTSARGGFIAFFVECGGDHLGMNGAAGFSTENRVMNCGLPLSKSWKSSCLSVPTARPWVSRTTTGTRTRFTRLLKVTGASRELTSAVVRALGLRRTERKHTPTTNPICNMSLVKSPDFWLIVARFV